MPTLHPKITLFGAGSAVFAWQVVTGFSSVEGHERGTFALVDVDPVRLELGRLGAYA